MHLLMCFKKHPVKKTDLIEQIRQSFEVLMATLDLRKLSGDL